MPSSEPLPTIPELLTSYSGAIRGTKDRYADTREGSIYEHFAGAGSILWTREAARDRDMWRSTYLDTADGEDLTFRVKQQFGIDRILDTRGQGEAVLVRPTTVAGGGTFWEGSRFSIVGSSASPKSYQVAATTEVSASATTAVVPIEATGYGPGWAIEASSANTQFRIDDPLWDNTWTVTSLRCSDGTTFERADVLRARVRAERRAQRRGYVQHMIDTCKAQGASMVALFESYWGTDLSTYDDDFGINACYVGDANYVGTTDLVRRCHVALERSRVLGASLLVLPMSTAALSVDLTVSLVSASTADRVTIERAIRGQVLGYFKGASSGFSYKREAIASAAGKVDTRVKSVTVTQPLTDVTLSSAAWPATLTRYTLRDEAIRVSFA